VPETPGTIPVERQTMDVDLVCVGFGPAMGGFLTRLAAAMVNPDGTPAIESKVAPGMPLQVICYERADGIGFGVSGVVTRGRGIRASFPQIDPSQIPMATSVSEEKLIYLLDPAGTSRRGWVLRGADSVLRVFGGLIGLNHDAFEIPWLPPFLHKKDGLVLSIGQFNQWVGEQLMASGAVQIWPGMPVAGPLLEDQRVCGVRLLDQGVERDGTPSPSFLPGMDIHAALTVVGDGPVGAVGQQLDDSLGMPEGNEKREWAVGAKMVIDLPENSDLKPGTVIHTIGYPEPEIFGFFYVHPGRIASAGIFVPSWYENPVRTSYRYLQHFLLHPYLWRYVEGGRLRSWGAKSLQESGCRGEPHLAGDGFARIGEGSGSTNVLTGSGVDEAWTTGIQLAEAVLELLKDNKPFNKENLETTYVRRRRNSWVEKEARIAEKSRDGFHHGVVSGLLGTALTGLTGGLLSIPGRPHSIRTAEEFFAPRLRKGDIEVLRRAAARKGVSLHDSLMEACGWPAIPYDGQLLMTHQDALLLGGKVQAPAGYADHVAFLYPTLCEGCNSKICVEICSGEAITSPKDTVVPDFDREKCVHCGACLWNCEHENIAFRAGAGGLHSAEN
jgi:electron-transferring-flavoprotein dehydrogenase